MSQPSGPLPFAEIPIIDLGGTRSFDISHRRSIAQDVRKACTEVGFFYVKNHGVPQAAIDRVIEQAKRFFNEPLERKMLIDIHNVPNFKGYTALLSENTDPENRGDLHEGFDIGWEALNGAPSSSAPVGENATGAMQGNNVWPPDLPGFKEPVLEYYHLLINLGKTLFNLFALALDLPENFFDDKTINPAAIFRLLHYPPQMGVVGDRVIGIGAHTDYECFTILWQDDVGGLQVMNTAEKWIDAKPIPGTFVINIGDQLARWTNDVFKSTRHRAINRSGVERFSTPLFFGTDYDVRLEAIPTCVSAENPAKYPVVTAGEYVQSRLEATYAHSK
ncbi:hypothetical protein FRB95_006901 [Tulasnella sp. JGI-2019a]|nr:hypothetical protein FRB95_006901 [Tulasnella sp. JGI-2019a]